MNGLPKGLFKDLAGIAIVTSVELGFLLSGTMGTGIVMKKTATGWSPPMAVGLSGLGFGILVGASTKELILFIYDDETLESIAKKHGCKIGSQLELTVGPFGRAGAATLTGSKGGVGAVFAVAYSKGVFGGLSLQGAKLGSRDFVNNKFYSAVVAEPRDILFTPGSVQPPAYAGEKTMLDDVYAKLDLLEKGGTAEPDAATEKKKEAAQDLAHEKEQEIKDSPEVVQVDAAAEAAKESSS